MGVSQFFAAALRQTCPLENRIESRPLEHRPRNFEIDPGRRDVAPGFSSPEQQPSTCHTVDFLEDIYQRSEKRPTLLSQSIQMLLLLKYDFPLRLPDCRALLVQSN